MYDAPPAQPAGQGQKSGGYKGGGQGQKREWDPRLTEKDFVMVRENSLTAAVETVKLEVASRAAAGGFMPEQEVAQRIEALAEQFYQGTVAKRKDMERAVPASLAQQAPAAQAPAAAQQAAYGAPGAYDAAAAQAFYGQQPPAAQPPAPAYPAPAPAPAAYQQPPVAPAPAGPAVNPAWATLPFADHLVPFGKHATLNGQKGNPHLTILELASGIDPGWLHWAAVKAPNGKYTDALTRAGNQGQCPSFQERVIAFLNAAEAAGNPVPKPEFNPNQ